jgi:hypothetical protein
VIDGKAPADRAAVDPRGLTRDAPLRIASPRGAMAFRVARSAFVRGLCMAQGIAACDRHGPRLARASGCTALIERRGFANSGIAVMP